MMINYKVKEIKKDTIVFISSDKQKMEVELPVEMFDTLMISVGSEVEINVVVPYGVSAQRRRDITEHHAEEARCGNI